MKTKNIISVVAILGLLITASIWYSQNNHLLPIAASDEALIYDGLFNSLLAIATGLFFLVQGTLLYCAFRFRRRQGDHEDGPPIHDNFLLEIIWTAIPTITVMFVGIYSFDVYTAMQGKSPNDLLASAHHHAPMLSLVPEARADVLPSATTPAAIAQVVADTEPEPLTVNVAAMQFAWIFTYPNNNELVTAELHVPVGSTVNLNFTANDVIHAFWVPQLRLKQDTVPGIDTHLQFTASKLGEYPVVCAELCGSYHGGMRTQMIVHTPEDYAAWLEQAQSEAETANNADLKQTVAMSNLDPKMMSDREYLAGKTKNLGISPATLHQIHQPHHTHHLDYQVSQTHTAMQTVAQQLTTLNAPNI